MFDTEEFRALDDALFGLDSLLILSAMHAVTDHPVASLHTQCAARASLKRVDRERDCDTASRHSSSSSRIKHFFSESRTPESASELGRAAFGAPPDTLGAGCFCAPAHQRVEMPLDEQDVVTLPLEEFVGIVCPGTQCLKTS